MIASIFFMSGKNPPFLPWDGTSDAPFAIGKNAARKYDSLQVDFLARCSRAWSTFDLPSLSPFRGQPPIVTVLRELTFGPPPRMKPVLSKATGMPTLLFLGTRRRQVIHLRGSVGFGVHKATLSPSSLVSLSHFIHENVPTGKEPDSICLWLRGRVLGTEAMRNWGNWGTGVMEGVLDDGEKEQESRVSTTAGLARCNHVVRGDLSAVQATGIRNEEGCRASDRFCLFDPTEYRRRLLSQISESNAIYMSE
jgi:hypothetical protein